jgi:glutathione S-transferase
MKLHLISHTLCPYVQRAVISLMEKGAPFERTDVDLGNKPDWFLEISPLGKTPVLVVDGTPIFESAPILEFLEETQPNPLHPQDPLLRAQHRAWIEFGSAVLNGIAGYYNAPGSEALTVKSNELRKRFARLEAELGAGPFFAGTRFSLVDAVFGPVFRYFDTFDRIADFGILTDLPKVVRWRRLLTDRPSVANAVTVAYPELLEDFIARRNSWLSILLRDAQHAAVARGVPRRELLAAAV